MLRAIGDTKFMLQNVLWFYSDHICIKTGNSIKFTKLSNIGFKFPYTNSLERTTFGQEVPKLPHSGYIINYRCEYVKMLLERI